MDILLAYHRHTVEGLILVMILNIIVPHLVRDNLNKVVIFSRIGFFLFWTLWSMVAFTGLITLVFTRMNMTAEIWWMIALIIFLPILDAYRAIRIRSKHWLNERSGVIFSDIIVIFELVLTVAMMFVAMK